MATQLNEAPRVVLNQDFADPDALRVGDTYYAYSTSNHHGNVPFATAPSVFGPWTRGGNALPNLGAWADGGGTWAPHVTQLASDRFVLYYTAHRKDISDYDVECIGVAVSSSPAGPFVPTGPARNEDGSAPLVGPARLGGAIDAETFTENGKLYLLYKVDGNRVGKPSLILLQELSPDGLTPIGGASTLLQSTAGAPDNGVVEAPHLEHHGSHYVLFYSSSFYGDDGYHTRYAMSPSLTSGYKKSSEPLITTDSLHGLALGPGGAVVLDDRTHILFHGWINNHQERAMYAAGLNWDSEDRPSLGTGTGPGLPEPRGG